MFRLIFVIAVFCIGFSSLLQAAPAYVIAFAQDTMDNDWRKAQVLETLNELKKHPQVEFVFSDAEANAALQAQHIDEFITKGVDIIITSPRDKNTLSPVIKKAYKKGIPVILLDRGIDGDDYTCFIHPENRPIARSAAEFLVSRLNQKGRILMLEGVPGATPTIHRSEGFLDVVSQYPEIKVIRKVANYLRSDAIIAVEQVLQQGLSIDAIYAQSDSMASGARMALELNGIDSSKIIIAGIDYIKEAREAILSGKQAISYTYPTGGREGADIAIQILNGESVPKEIILQSIPVTRSNADKVEPVF
jgi:ABC-type sugar transport system substrate-binding protein